MPNDPINHVVVLMLENRSFDHLLGCIQQVKPLADGIPAGGATRANDYNSQSYLQSPGASRQVEKDPKHEYPNVMVQLEKDPNGKPNSGFVKDYAQSYPDLPGSELGEVMKYHDLDTLPALHTLARSFLLCDRWFASVPGPTWCNRLFAMSGTSLGRISMPGGTMDLSLHWYHQPTLFDRLNEQNQTWKVYFGDFPLSLLLVHQWEPKNAARHKRMTEFYEDAAGSPDEFPALAWIEPDYLDPGANDDHPPHDLLDGEALIAQVYNALRANEPLWQSTLLAVLFDEHGGFYDHVEPSATVAPDQHQEEYSFDRLGVRVPAILASPWAPNNVLREEFDHTSLLKYLTEKWQLGPLGNRVAQAKSFTGVFLPQARTDTPKKISLPQNIAALVGPPKKQLTENQQAIVAASHALESMAGEDAHTVATRSHQALSGAQSQMDAAVDRVDAFLKHKREEAGK